MLMGSRSHTGFSKASSIFIWFMLVEFHLICHLRIFFLHTPSFICTLTLAQLNGCTEPKTKKQSVLLIILSFRYLSACFQYISPLQTKITTCLCRSQIVCSVLVSVVPHSYSKGKFVPLGHFLNLMYLRISNPHTFNLSWHLKPFADAIKWELPTRDGNI